MNQKGEGCIRPSPSLKAPHLAEHPRSNASDCLAKLSKRELDYRPVLLLPFGAKPSALVLY